MPVEGIAAVESPVSEIAVENMTEDFFAEPVLPAGPAGTDDLDFHLLNIPPKPARELRMR